ncbi:MAG: hypothetical protein GYA59_15295, partial [Chloroflexi bacterium]|nr:hypothetical protein [Chloroflexota bacterium]
LSNPEDSFERARQAAQRPWAAEIARIEMLNKSQQLEFHTGNPAWDTALALAQRTAFSLLFQCNQSSQMSFVLSRQPDQGFSFRGDGSDYGYPWSGQTALDTYYLNSLLLPGGAELAKGLLLHLLENQDKTGFIDLKPGLAGQRCHCLAQPLLATIALQIDSHLTDSAWLAEIYPRLLRFFEIWFQPNHDRDQDGFPEWEHPLQTGLQDGTIYDRWHPASQGVAIGCLESPALGALLYRECHSLMQIGQRLHNEENLPALQEKAHTLKQAVESTWDAKTASYHYRDAQSHQSSHGASLLQFAGSGKRACNRHFRRPQRLQIILSAHDSHTRPVTMTIVGQGEAGELREHITPNRFSWYHGQACYTTQALFQSVAHVEVQGFGKADQGSLKRIDYTQEDIGLLLPLWAQIPSPKRAQILIEKTLRPRYLGLNGLAAFPFSPEPAETAGPNPVHMLWNHLLGEALLAYGYHALAADLFTRLMNAILPALQQEGAFRETYPSGHGRRGGAHNSLYGLPPLGLLLPLLGIHRLGPRGFFLQGIIPFTGTSTVKYQGIAITRQAQDSGVRLSTGETIQLSTPGSHRIRIR